MPQASAFADRSGDFFRLRKLGTKVLAGSGTPGVMKSFSRSAPFRFSRQVWRISPAPQWGHSDVACSVASLHADACCRETGAVPLFVLNQLLQGHVYIEFIPMHRAVVTRSSGLPLVPLMPAGSAGIHCSRPAAPDVPEGAASMHRVVVALYHARHQGSCAEG